MESCKQSGNDPQHHVVGADNMVSMIGVAMPENIPSAELIKNVEKRAQKLSPGW